MTDTLAAAFRAAFGRDPEIIARAPGRIEFIGNHTDYNGGTVLGAAIDKAVWVAFAPRADGRRRFGSDGQARTVELAASVGERQSGAAAWVNYPLGVLVALKGAGVRVPDGFDLWVHSTVPTGAGLSSSAALELASCLAFLAASKESLSSEAMVAICRKAENEFVGVPCGILDQGVSCFGRKDHLVHIDCRVSKFSTVPLPAGLGFWIFNTHAKHALVDGLYAERHRECMEAAKGLGVALLVDATAPALAAAETRLSRNAYKRARHVIDEISRVNQTVAALAAGDTAAVGRLLFASHRSSRTWFENSVPELDFLVDRLELCKGVVGARLTGGGFGGAVMALTTAQFDRDLAAQVSEDYFGKFRSRLDVLRASADDGAALVKAGT